MRSHVSSENRNEMQNKKKTFVHRLIFVLLFQNFKHFAIFAVLSIVYASESTKKGPLEELEIKLSRNEVDLPVKLEPSTSPNDFEDKSKTTEAVDNGKSISDEETLEQELKQEGEKRVKKNLVESEAIEKRFDSFVKEIEDDVDTLSNYRGLDWFDDDEDLNFVKNRLAQFSIEKPKSEFPKTNKDTKLPIFHSAPVFHRWSDILEQYKPQILGTNNAEINLHQSTPKNTPHINNHKNRIHIVADNQIPHHTEIVEEPSKSPINSDDEFVKPVLDGSKKTYWEQMRDHFKSMEEKMIIKKKLEILEDYKNKLLSTKKAFIDGIKKKFTMVLPSVSPTGVVFEKKEIDLF